MSPQSPSVNDKDVVHPYQEIVPSTQSYEEEGNYESVVDDIDCHIQCNVKGFYEKYFATASWFSAAEHVVLAVQEDFLDHQKLQSRIGFLEWLWRFQLALPKGQRAHYTCIEKPFSKLDFSNKVLVMSRINDSKREPTWTDVLVVGELCLDESEMHQAVFLRICGHARAVFAYQPARLFLHGFCMCGRMVELWVFDRSGIYSCEAFDVSESLCRFLTVLVGYTFMSDAQLGLSTLIKDDGLGKHILGIGDDQPDAEKLYLEDLPMFARQNKDLVSDGLTCYRAKRSTSERWEFVVKIKWSPTKDATEAHLLKLVKERKVSRVLQLFSHQDVGSTKNLRHGLLFGVSRKLKSSKQDDGSNSGQLNADGVGCALDSTIEITGTKISNNEPFENKIFSCTIVSPIGRSLHRFETIPELLKVLCDAVKGHRSLYLDGGILHQDISPSNIIIITSNDTHEEALDPKGVLIDLDSARELSAGPGKQFEGIGTQPFKSIGVLMAYLPNNPHTYRHDLESLFYTFLFLAICPRPVPPGENQLQLPPTSILQQWTLDRPIEQARRKINDMHATQFSRITAEFTPEFKGLTRLAQNLRSVLFPLRDGKLWTGTDMSAEGRDALYGSMINAFDMAIASDYKL